MEKETFQTLEEGIILLEKEARNRPISLGKILEVLSGRGRALLILFLSLPFCLPIQIPGMSTPFGVVIAFIGLRIAFSHRVWIPRRILAIRLEPKKLDKLLSSALSFVQKTRRFTHPRYTHLVRSPLMMVANGVFIFFLGMILALPLPIPLSNLFAAWSLFFIALALLEDDGLFVLLSYAIAIAGGLFFTFLTKFLLKVVPFG